MLYYIICISEIYISIWNGQRIPAAGQDTKRMDMIRAVIQAKLKDTAVWWNGIKICLTSANRFTCPTFFLHWSIFRFFVFGWKRNTNNMVSTCPLSIPVWMTASLNKHLTAGPGRRDAFTWGQEDPDPRYWSFQDQAATGCHSCHVHVHILSKSILESIMDIAWMCFEKAVSQSVLVSNI